jgi:3-hydroxyisobutyrate dehydrogenase-like beta-hydroxyacid dehydrogenase
LVHVLGRGAIHVSMSTVSPGLSRRLAHQHELAGQGYVAAPVLGNPDLAEARKLFVIVRVHRQLWAGFRRCSAGLGNGCFFWGTIQALPIS